ncbi:hypothetical protein V1507DRAFT_452451 [Lipomyces tetrasporus]
MIFAIALITDILGSSCGSRVVLASYHGWLCGEQVCYRRRRRQKLCPLASLRTLSNNSVNNKLTNGYDRQGLPTHTFMVVRSTTF